MRRCRPQSAQVEIHVLDVIAAHALLSRSAAAALLNHGSSPHLESPIGTGSHGLV